MDPKLVSDGRILIFRLLGGVYDLLEPPSGSILLAKFGEPASRIALGRAKNGQNMVKMPFLGR